jgi:hypothetical protein
MRLAYTSITHSETRNGVTGNELKKGARLEANKMIMVITGESKTAYLGYYEYKGKPAGQCSLLKSVFENAHLSKSLVVIRTGE